MLSSLMGADKRPWFLPQQLARNVCHTEIVMRICLQQRVNGSPVFLNPFRNRIPGNITGPEDLLEKEEWRDARVD